MEPDRNPVPRIRLWRLKAELSQDGPDTRRLRLTVAGAQWPVWQPPGETDRTPTIQKRPAATAGAFRHAAQVRTVASAVYGREEGAREGCMPMSRSRDLCTGSAALSSSDWREDSCWLPMLRPFTRSCLPATWPARSCPTPRSLVFPSRPRPAWRSRRCPRPRSGICSRSMLSRCACLPSSLMSLSTPRPVAPDARVT